MRSPLAKYQFEAPQRGIKNSFRLGDVGEMIIPLPPLPEQHRIVAKVDKFMSLLRLSGKSNRISHGHTGRTPRCGSGPGVSAQPCALKSVYISHYKNLKDFSLEFDSDSFIDVFVGKNGTGKSNLFEALILIFQHIDEFDRTWQELDFDYRLKFSIDDNGK